jgi:hypothetical protein
MMSDAEKFELLMNYYNETMNEYGDAYDPEGYEYWLNECSDAEFYEEYEKVFG